MFDEVHYLLSGKFRRYHNQPILVRIFDLKTIFLNIRDLIKISLGIIQGIFLLRGLKADSLLLKGGSVCIPAGIGARFAGVVTITHDSDALLGVSNRIGGKHAKYHTTAMPVANIGYSDGKMIYVGLPISDNFRHYTDREVERIKRRLEIPEKSKVLLITGGSNGAKRLNDWCAEALPQILEKNLSLYVIFVHGRLKGVNVKTSADAKKRILMIDFTDEMHNLGAIADIVVTRAGATTIAEFAGQSKALILVPNPDLTRGHQIKNAKLYAENSAVVLFTEVQFQNTPEEFVETVSTLLGDPKKRRELGQNLHRMNPPVTAAKTLAKLLLESRG